MINKFCKSGFIAVPSKFTESKKGIEGAYRGYIHHRYIFNFENGQLVGYPKLNFIEYDVRFDQLSNDYCERKYELQVYWEDSFNLKIINDNYMGPKQPLILQYYDGILSNPDGI